MRVLQSQVEGLIAFFETFKNLAKNTPKSEGETPETHCHCSKVLKDTRDRRKHRSRYSCQRSASDSVDCSLSTQRFASSHQEKKRSTRRESVYHCSERETVPGPSRP